MNLAAQAHFNNYDPSSFGWRIEPKLVPFTFGGVNFGNCARDVLPVFVALLTELEPHIPGGIAFGPHDDWAYSATDELPDGSPSFHHYGIAFDLNWRENPMGNYRNNPNVGDKGVIPYDTAARLARKYGCEYGGTWSGGANRLGFKDYMHFECHLEPAVARTAKIPAPSNPSIPTVTTTEASMPIIVRVSRKDAAKQKVRWPGYFEFRADGTLTHIPTLGRLQALIALGCPVKDATIAKYRALGGK